MRVFLDACVVYSAGRSPGGGSARILIESRERGLTLLFTMEILSETKRHIIEDLGKDAFTNLISLLRQSSRELVSNPSQKEKKTFEGITVEKDLHVLAGAVKGKADVLVTLDRKHLLKEKVREAFPIPIMNTKEFWKAVREGSL